MEREIILKMSIDDIKAVKSIEQLKIVQSELNKEFEKSEIGSESYSRFEKQVAATRSRIKELTDATKAQTNALGGVNASAKFAEGSYGALRQRIQQLKKDLDQTIISYDEAGEATGEYKRVHDELTAALVEEIKVREKLPSLLAKRIQQGVDESKVLADQADKMAKMSEAIEFQGRAASSLGKALGLPTEQMDALLNKVTEVAAAIKEGFEAGKKTIESFSKSAEEVPGKMDKGSTAAKGFGLTTKSALIATGIGAFIVLLGVIIANWEAIKNKVTELFPVFNNLGSIWDKIRQIGMGFFMSVIESLKVVGESVTQLVQGNFSEAAKTANSWGARVSKAFNEGKSKEDQRQQAERLKEATAQEIEVAERRLKVMQAGGEDTTKLQREIFRKQLSILDQGTKEYLDKLTEAQAFEAGLRKKNADEAKAAAEKIAAENKALAEEIANQIKTSNDAIALLRLDGYQKELKQLEIEKRDRLEAAKGNAQAILLVEEEFSLRRQQIEKTHQDEIQKIQDDALKYIERSKMTDRQRSMAEIDDRYKEELNKFEKLGIDKSLLDEKYRIEREKKNKEMDDREAEKNKRAAAKLISDEEARQDALLRLRESQAETEAEIFALQIERHELVQEAAQRAYAAEMISIEERNAMIAASERQIQDLRQETINRSFELTSQATSDIGKLFKDQSKAALAFETVSQKIDQARALRSDILTLKEQLLGISAQLKLPFPANIVAVASTIALIGSSMAKVKSLFSSSSNDMPSFADGVIDFRSDGNGSIVSGRGTGRSDEVNAYISNGESVINARSTAMFKPLLSAINQAGGGRAFIGNQYPTSLFKSMPQIITGSPKQETINYAKMGVEVARAMRDAPSPVTFIDDINTAQTNVNGVETKSSI